MNSNAETVRNAAHLRHGKFDVQARAAGTRGTLLDAAVQATSQHSMRTDPSLPLTTSGRRRLDLQSSTLD